MEPAGVRFMFFLLVVIAAGVGVIFVLPRHISRKILLVVALLGLGLLFGILFRAMIDEHGPPPVARVIAFLGLVVVGLMFILAELRLFAPAVWGALSVGRWGAAPDGRLRPSLAARIGSLPIPGVLLASLPLVFVAYLILIAVWPPHRSGELFEALFATLFCWADFFAVPVSLAIWVCREFSGGGDVPAGRWVGGPGEGRPLLDLLRRLSGWQLLLAAAVSGFIWMAVMASLDGRPHNEWRAFLAILLFPWPIALFIWGIVRLVRRAARETGGVFCPPIGRLKDLLAERLPAYEQARLAAHLERCPTCQHRLEGLTAGQKSWAGLASKLSERPPSPGPALRQVMNRLKEEEVEMTGDEPAMAGDLPLGFLSPGDKPGQLGRLERYEVLEEIGRGGMGVVLKAFDPSLHRVVAIKVLAPQLATSGVARKRFLREAKAAAAVSHDHIVTIHAVDEANGLPYLVMQYVAGQSLQDKIDRDGPLELPDVLRIGMQTASALAAAHAHGIVHRDVKPGNILLEEGVGRVKITDFGLARAMDDASLTQSGFVAGSPLYMAPEQARGEALDHRADLFSLGSVLYTMCTGRPPFRAANTLAVLRRVSEDSPRPIRETNPEIPDWLAAVVDRLLAKDPADRYPSANEVVDVLGRHLAQLQGASWTPPPAAPEPGLPTSLTICPSCGANLHVPEHMVGTLVHCAECGKPFQVEETSEVIQVARPMKPPFGPAARPRRRRVPAGAWVVGGCGMLVLLFFLLFFAFYVVVRKSESVQPAKTAPSTTTPESTRPGADPFWKSSLSWLPPEATCFGALDLRPFGSSSLEDARTQALLRLIVPEKTAEKLTPENLGRIRLDGVALAYYDDPKLKDERLIVHLDGLALDGRRRITQFLQQAAPEKVRVEEDPNWNGRNKPVRISSPAFPFALGIWEDHHTFLASSLVRDAGADQHRKVLEQVNGFNFSGSPRPQGDVLSGYNPPWLRNALNEVPPEACGWFVGEIPAGVRKLLTDSLKLRACPRSFLCYLIKRGPGVAVSLTLNVDRAGVEMTLASDLGKFRRQGLEMWQEKYPALRKESKSLALLRQELQAALVTPVHDMQSVRVTLNVSERTWDVLLALLKQASQ